MMFLQHRREGKSKKTRISCPFPELCGLLFERGWRTWVLLYGKKGWEVCHAFGGVKGLDVRDSAALRMVEGYKDGNLWDSDNYYWGEYLNTKAKTAEKILHAVESLGFERLEGKLGDRFESFPCPEDGSTGFRWLGSAD